MQATLERTTAVDPVHGMLPSVTYDQENSQITATLVVSLPAGSETPSIQAPIIAIPKAASPWTLVWRIQVDTATLTRAAFAPLTGIQLPGPSSSMPLDVEFGKSERVAEQEWSAALTNQTKSTSQFFYDISVDWTPIAGNPQQPLVHTVHDPTIVVTPEPMG